MVLKVCDAATQSCHRKALGMAYTSMTNGFSFDTIFLRGEEEAEKSARNRVARLAEAKAMLNGCWSINN